MGAQRTATALAAEIQDDNPRCAALSGSSRVAQHAGRDRGSVLISAASQRVNRQWSGKKHSLLLQRIGAPVVTVLDVRADLAIPVWAAPTVLAVRAPVPGGVITDLQVLADGRVDLAVASLAAPAERQAWLLDPTLAHLERVGPATRDDLLPPSLM